MYPHLRVYIQLTLDLSSLAVRRQAQRCAYIHLNDKIIILTGTQLKENDVSVCILLLSLWNCLKPTVIGAFLHGGMSCYRFAHAVD
jgi:hypothetical protein